MALPLLRGRSVRARSAIASALAIAVVLGVVIVGFTLVMRWSADGQTRELAETTAEVLADRVAIDGLPVVTEYDGESLVQVVDASDRVAAAGGGAANLTVPNVSGPATIDGTRYYVVDLLVPNTELHVRVARAYDDDTESRRTAQTVLVGVAPTLLVLVAILAWFSTSRALRPVADIGREVEAIGASDLHRRIEVPPTRDEIADLAGTMNALLDRLQSGSEAQRRFVADASHELRSPLATLRQYAELARTHPGDLAPGELADVVDSASRRLQTLVDDLLVLATVAEGGEQERGEIDLDDLVLSELTAFRSSGVVVDSSAVRPTKVAGQERRLAMVVRNLLANAMRHTSSRVRVATGSDGDGAYLVVADDGPGVPVDQRERIFDRFVRLDDGRARDEGGSGLGLAIVAAVVTEGGGTVVVDEAPGGGARFTVRLPVWDGWDTDPA
ncbi:cell wall metabolism sensor histidine kinase WalK [Aeromicrobium sp. Leaf350]|uniref:sensor histidine kinase n=1 Tax=Aeromicrobium sp. Leaf350 TaxID=2876565 RepID=UPI001E33EBE0|nr:HAMP domain-containing sensor histidine kinase [Aeromicrobium sp. Leaf350]